MSVPFPIGKLGVAPAGCMSDVTEMECGRSEIEELIKEVSGGVSGIFQEDQTLLLTLRGIESLGLSYPRDGARDSPATSLGQLPSTACPLGYQQSFVNL